MSSCDMDYGAHTMKMKEKEGKYPVHKIFPALLCKCE